MKEAVGERAARRSQIFSSEKGFQSLAKRFSVLGPAFPDNKHLPAIPSERFNMLPVPFCVSFALAAPIVRVGNRRNASVAAFVHVPEAAMDENYLLARD